MFSEASVVGDVNEGGLGSERGCKGGWWLSCRALQVMLVGLDRIYSKACEIVEAFLTWE